VKKNLLIIVIIILVIAAGGAYFVFFRGENTANTNTNQNQPILNLNQNSNENTNADIDDINANQNSAITTEEVTVQGMIFLKGYKTPSESYGISTTDGHEIGLGKYDSMKEQFRPYIGEQVKVTFETICRSTNQDCCRTLFYYCGMVKSWEPVEK